MKNLNLITCALFSLLVITACADQVPQPLNNSPTCESVDNNDGSFTFSCAGAEPVTIRNGVDGEDGEDGVNGLDDEGACIARPQEDGSLVLSCPDEEDQIIEPDLNQTISTENGCVITPIDESSFSLKCPDAPAVTIQSGQDGEDGVDGQDGQDGQDGANCLAEDHQDGSFTISCPGSDPVTIRNGEDGEDGEDAEPCIINQNDGVQFIQCPNALPTPIGGGANIVFGDLQVKSNLDLQLLREGQFTITGTLFITDQRFVTVDLTGVTAVNYSIHRNQYLQSLTISQEEIEGRLVISSNPNLVDLNIPNLRETSRDVRIGSNNSLEHIAFPSLSITRGEIDLTGPALTTVDFPELTIIQNLEIRSPSLVQDVDLQKLIGSRTNVRISTNGSCDSMVFSLPAQCTDGTITPID